jgi:splicing factor 3B subunit 1
MALGVYGFGCEDALIHLMNYVWPNIFETSPHMMQSFNDAVEGFRVSVGPGKVLQYTLQVRGRGGENIPQHNRVVSYVYP